MTEENEDAWPVVSVFERSSDRVWILIELACVAHYPPKQRTRKRGSSA